MLRCSLCRAAAVLLLLVCLAGAGIECFRLRAAADAYASSLDQANAVLTFIDLERPAYNRAGLRTLLDYEHVTGFRLPSLVHFFTDGLVLISPEETLRTPERLREGRWFSGYGECCLNRAAYDALLADPGSGFTGLGGTVELGDAPNHVLNSRLLSRRMTVTVVGVVEDEGKYADEALYGERHVYAEFEQAAAFYIDYPQTIAGFRPDEDYAHYLPYQKTTELDIRAMRVNPSGELQFRSADGTIYTWDELCAAYDGYLNVTAGYTVQLLLDSSDAIEETIRMLSEAAKYSSTTVAQRYAEYEKLADDAIEKEKTPVKLPEVYRQIFAEGTADEWYIYGTRYHYYAYHTPDDTTALTAAFMSQRRAYLTRIALCAAGALLSLAAAILFTALRRRAEKALRDEPPAPFTPVPIRPMDEWLAGARRAGLYRALTPLRSLWRNAGKYGVFAILLVLLLALNLTVRIAGNAAAERSAALTDLYARSFLIANIRHSPVGTAEFFTDEMPEMEYVEDVQLCCAHTLNTELSLVLYGAPTAVLGAEPIEGRLYENESECCISESYAAYLRENTDFSGIGDTVFLYDYEHAVQKEVEYITRHDYIMHCYPRDRSAELTVVGVFADSDTIFPDALSTGVYRVYTETAAVTPFYDGIESKLLSHNSPAYSLNNLKMDLWSDLAEYGCAISEDGTHFVFLPKDGVKTYTLADIRVPIQKCLPNEGYFAIVRLERAEDAAAFRQSFCGRVRSDIKKYLENLIAHEKALGKEPYLDIETDAGTMRFYPNGSGVLSDLWYAAYLIDDPESLTESLAPIGAMCRTVAAVSAVASAALILMMTLLVVSERRYEIGVLRCIGVSNAGVCARFAAELVLLLVLLAALGIGVGIPLAEYAASLLGASAGGALLPTALSLLAQTAAASAVSLLLAAALILVQKPMRILNSRT